MSPSSSQTEIHSADPRVIALCWGEDTSEFRPERFIETNSYQWPRSTCKRPQFPCSSCLRYSRMCPPVLPFSGGARLCIGQRLTVAAMVGVLASVVRQYHIRVPDDLTKNPLEVQQKTLLKWKGGISLTPVNARVKLCRQV